MPNPFEIILPTLKRFSRKWEHYYDIYHQHFNKFIGQAPTILEIGVENGGSLETWSKYFGPGTRVVGLDVDPRWAAAASKEEGIEVLIGNQGDPHVLDSLIKQVPQPQIVVDDGSHISAHQILTFEKLFPHIADGGVYLCEDLACSYFKTHHGSYRGHDTIIEYFKRLIDDMHADHHAKHTSYTRMINGMHVYDQIVVIDKANNRPVYGKKKSP